MHHLNRRFSAVGGTADFCTFGLRPTLQAPSNQVIRANDVSCQGWLNQVHSFPRPPAESWSALVIMDSLLAANAVIMDVGLSSRAAGAIKHVCSGVHQGCANVPSIIPDMSHTQLWGLPAMAKSLCHCCWALTFLRLSIPGEMST